MKKKRKLYISTDHQFRSDPLNGNINCNLVYFVTLLCVCLFFSAFKGVLYEKEPERLRKIEGGRDSDDGVESVVFLFGGTASPCAIQFCRFITGRGVKIYYLQSFIESTDMNTRDKTIYHP